MKINIFTIVLVFAVLFCTTCFAAESPKRTDGLVLKFTGNNVVEVSGISNKHITQLVNSICLVSSKLVKEGASIKKGSYENDTLIYNVIKNDKVIDTITFDAKGRNLRVSTVILNLVKVFEKIEVPKKIEKDQMFIKQK